MKVSYAPIDYGQFESRGEIGSLAICVVLLKSNLNQLETYGNMTYEIEG